MARLITGFSGVLVFLLLTAGCDSFSVLEEFQKVDRQDSREQFVEPGPLRLVPQKITLQPDETIGLDAGGGEAPYSFALSAGSLYYNSTLGSVIGQTYTAGSSIGTVKISLTDGNGDSVECLVTIVPPTPADFAVQPDGRHHTRDIVLSWTINVDGPGMISGYRILRSDSQGNETVTDIPAGSTSCIDTVPSQTRYYRYRLCTMAGEYLSPPSPEAGCYP